MTRFTAAVVATFAWILSSSNNGCDASLVAQRSSLLSSSSSSSSLDTTSMAATAVMDDEEGPSFFYDPLASANEVGAGRTNHLRHAAPLTWSSTSKGLDNGRSANIRTLARGRIPTEAVAAANAKEDDNVPRRTPHDLREDGDGNRPVKTVEGLARKKKKKSMTKERPTNWAQQLGISKNNVNQLLQSYSTKEATMAARTHILSKSHSQKEAPSQRKLVQPFTSVQPPKMPLSSSSSSSSDDTAVDSLSTSPLSSFHGTGNANANAAASQPRRLFRKTQESSLALEACLTAIEFHGDYSDAACTCSEDSTTTASSRYVMDCVEACIFCSDANSTICANESNQYYFEAETGAVLTKSKTYSYSTGKDDTITLLETGCALDGYLDGDCTGCVASVDGTTCNSCSLQSCSYEEFPSEDESYFYQTLVLDCTNTMSSLGVYNLCGNPPIPVEDPLHALGNPGFMNCADQGTGACEAEKVLREAESDDWLCECVNAYDGNVQLRCSDQCGLFCNEEGDECVRSTLVVGFSTYQVRTVPCL
jgi:hypothetical protein